MPARLTAAQYARYDCCSLGQKSPPPLSRASPRTQCTRTPTLSF